MKAMEQPVNGDHESLLGRAWIILAGFGAGIAKFFDSYLLLDSYLVATFKAGIAAGFVALCAAGGSYLFKLIKPWLDKKVEKFKNKNKPS